MSKSATSLLLDFEGWKRALNPALRTIGYTAAIYVILVILIIYPASVVGGQVFAIAVNLVTVFMFVAFVVSLFKVIDEERTSSGMIKLL